MVICISGGIYAKAEALFLIFRHNNRTHPIQGSPDNVRGVSSRTQPSEWMDSGTFNWCLREIYAIAMLPNEQQCVLYCDNAKGNTLNNNTFASIISIRTLLHKLPPNTTHLCSLRINS